MGSNQQFDLVEKLNIIQDKWEGRFDKLQDKYDKLQDKYDKLQDKYDKMERCYRDKLDQNEHNFIEQLNSQRDKKDEMEHNFEERFKSQRDKYDKMERCYRDELDQKEQRYNELLDKYDSLRQEIIQNHTNQHHDSASNSSQSSSSLSNQSIEISQVTEEQARDILRALSFQGACETKVETFLPVNHDHIEFKDSPLNWDGFEDAKNIKLCIDKLVKQLKTIGIDLEDKSKDFKIVDVSRQNSFLKCNFLDTFASINGTCDAVIVPRAIHEEFCQTQLRVMFEFKAPKYFSSSGLGQIIGELMGGSYNSFHPLILIKTDLAKNYEIWQIRGKVIYKCTTTAEMAFKSIAHWINNICSNNPIFDPRKDPFDENFTCAFLFFEEKFKKRIREEICSLLREQLEVAEMADADLPPYEKFLSTQQVFNNFFNI